MQAAMGQVIHRFIQRDYSENTHGYGRASLASIMNTSSV
jgi:hypothetical protein